VNVRSNPSPPQREHRPGERAPARLTWSLTPHSPAEGFTALRWLSSFSPTVSRGGQVLHLNRTMLGDQLSSYVGRFACDWHRLPGWIPGQPQTQTGALRASIAPGSEPAERPRGCHQPHLVGAGSPQRSRARQRRGSGGHHVVDQQDPRRDRRSPDDLERTCERCSSVGSDPPGLRASSLGPGEQSSGGDPHHPRERVRERLRLVVSTVRETVPRQRHPGDYFDVGRADREHRGRESLRHRSEPAELQAVDRSASRTSETERRPRAEYLVSGAIAASRFGADQRPPAALAPRRRDRLQPFHTSSAERPVTITA
jgi:hypothetical protein